MAKQSLAAQSGAISAELKLPDVFQAPPDKILGRQVSPYVCFAHSKRADEWKAIAAKHGSVEEGDMFLIRPDKIHKLEVAKLGWLRGKQYWAQTNPAGEVLKTSFEEKPGYKEHIEAVVLVYFDDEIVPANIQFRTTRCPAAKILSDALEKASTPAWGDESPAHKETLVINQPFFRFYGDVTLGPKRTSKSSGLPYRTTQCTIKPVGIAEIRLIKAFTENPDTQKALNMAAERYNWRIGEVTKKAA